MNPRTIQLIARTVLLEAIRRKEVYVVVIGSLLLIGAVMTVDFFGLEGVSKFYREVALKVMGVATGLTVIFLGARQLPREFETRTIYTLLAKPVSRLEFLAGKLAGVMLSAMFCFALFMAAYVIGAIYIGSEIPWGLFLQYIYLQMIQMLILATLSFWLSMILNLDAAISISVLFYFLAATLVSMTTYLYYVVDPISRIILTALVWGIPQLSLFDLSEKAVHASAWSPLSFSLMATLTIYGLFYAVGLFLMAARSFERRAL